MRITTFEEHYVTERLLDVNGDHGLPEAIINKLLDVGEGRIADMDAAGIDLQVLSAMAPATQDLNEGVAVPFAEKLNDRLKTDVIDAWPGRFAGFATLPMKAPEAAADELRRTVGELGFLGGLINGMVDDKFLSDEIFHPVLQAAQDLNVPIYLHPNVPPKRVRSVYYKNMQTPAQRTLAMNGHGWHYETGLHIQQLIVEGTMDAFPDLQWIIGHAGEGLPFHVDRDNDTHAAAGTFDELELDSFTEYYHRNLYVTSAGYPYDDAFRLARKVFGDDRVMFSVDYPFAGIVESTQWLLDLDVTPDLRERLAHRTADQLLGLDGSGDEGENAEVQ
jgi:predicted TIM-barrel fold metal-dependent hydrolase